MISLDKLKEAVGWEALKYVKAGTIVGVGTGSTANYFIDALASIKNQIKGAVSTSKSSTEKLIGHGITIVDCNDITQLSVYIDGADEINCRLQMIKGGSAALTSEKIVAAMAEKFVCIVDQSKVVERLGRFPLPVEVIPMARSYVSRELTKLGGQPIYRKGSVTDHGNIVLDVHNLVIKEPTLLEDKINAIAGVVTVGLFARRPANLVLVGKPEGVVEMVASH